MCNLEKKNIGLESGGAYWLFSFLCVPHVVPDGGQGKLGTIAPLAGVPIFCSDRTRSAIGATQTVCADDEESRSVKRSPRAPEERTPPVANIRAASQSMANHHSIVAVGRQRAPCRVCDGDIAKRHTGLEGEGRDYGEPLVGNERRERILWLRLDSFLEVFSHRFCHMKEYQENTEDDGRGD